MTVLSYVTLTLATDLVAAHGLLQRERRTTSAKSYAVNHTCRPSLQCAVKGDPALSSDDARTLSSRLGKSYPDQRQRPPKQALLGGDEVDD